jgi:hypothetical protein
MNTKIHQEGEVLVVQYDGPLTFKTRTEVLDQVLPAIKEQGIRRLLIDCTGAWLSREKGKAAEDFASKLAGASDLKATAVAFLNPPYDYASPVELVAPIIGFRVQRFFNRQRALEWLRSAG